MVLKTKGGVSMPERRALSDTEIADLAAVLVDLDWSWKMADAPGIATSFGWEVRAARPQWVTFDVGFGMDTGKIRGRDDHAHSIQVAVTEGVIDEANGKAWVHDCFVRMSVAVSARIGEPTQKIPGEYPEIRWAATSTTLRLVELDSSVQLFLHTNTYLAEHDAAIEMERQGLL
ncbi:hypothetical protein J2W56_006653 [Nocardia kruczakiae]|uniref:Uncharacterized protein n=1 Tax=Nocardia kruczakiae TaxID=261477 RepID=A0ABU1XSE1_9NOCA|nr:DUF6301 family protein [Nocardia kruczakiae]MDR7172887.1 hypothetical protein [Nocardia kruczakiae]